MAFPLNQDSFLAPPAPQLEMNHMPSYLSIDAMPMADSFMDISTFPSQVYTSQALDPWSFHTPSMGMPSNYEDIIPSSHLNSFGPSQLGYSPGFSRNSTTESLLQEAFAGVPIKTPQEDATSKMFSSSFSSDCSNIETEGFEEVHRTGSHSVEHKPCVSSLSDEHPGEPYAKLIHRALMSSPTRSMVLQEIYQWFRRHTPSRTRKSETGWKNSIRHNLSMNAAFRKVECVTRRGKSKKSTEWALEPFAITEGVQSTTRYRKGVGLKKSLRRSEIPRRSKPRWKVPKHPMSLQESMGYSSPLDSGLESNTNTDPWQPLQMQQTGDELPFFRQVSPMTALEPALASYPYFVDNGLGVIDLENLGVPFLDTYNNTSFGVLNTFPSEQNWWTSNGLPVSAP